MRKFWFYYNLGLLFVVLAFIPISNNVALTHCLDLGRQSPMSQETQERALKQLQ